MTQSTPSPREDYLWIRYFALCPRNTLSDARLYQSLPLFILKKDDMKGVYNSNTIILPDLPFREFVIIAEMPKTTDRREVMGYYYIKFHADMIEVKMYATVATWDGQVVESRVYLPYIIVGSDIIIDTSTDNYKDLRVNISSAEGLDDILDEKSPHIETTHVLICSFLSRLGRLLTQATEADKYIATQTPAKSNKKVSVDEDKKPWTHNQSPRVIFLNQMPSETRSSLGGSHASPVGHPRRGHRHRLMHEKYQNHPKYQDPNGIWIRPTWVGPTEAVVHGNVYKIYE